VTDVEVDPQAFAVGEDVAIIRVGLDLCMIVKANDDLVLVGNRTQSLGGGLGKFPRDAFRTQGLGSRK
jgi:hypothetical protein